ncbi:hypothetical protein V1478_009506, partial [Vespula squamosa]
LVRPIINVDICKSDYILKVSLTQSKCNDERELHFVIFVLKNKLKIDWMHLYKQNTQRSFSRTPDDNIKEETIKINEPRAKIGRKVEKRSIRFKSNDTLLPFDKI